MMEMMRGAPYVLSEESDWSSMADMMEGTTWPYQGGFGRNLWGLNWALQLILWLALIAVLIALARYFWKKGDEIK